MGKRVVYPFANKVRTALPDAGRYAKTSVRKGLSQERARGFEPLTSSLGSWHSTTELRPQVLVLQGFASSLLVAFSLVATESGRRHNSLARHALRRHGGCHTPPHLTPDIVTALPRPAKRVVPRFLHGHFGGATILAFVRRITGWRRGIPFPLPKGGAAMKLLVKLLTVPPARCFPSRPGSSSRRTG